MKKLRTLTNAILALVMTSTMLLSSCKKDDKDNGPKLSEDQIEACVEGATTISTQMQQMVVLSMSKAAESGYDTGDIPDIDDSKKSGSIANYGSYSWSGPDAQGWYYRKMDGLYKYEEKMRIKNDTIIYVHTISYDGGEGSYKNETTTKYIKYIKNNKELYKGSSVWDVHASGYNDISRFQWKIEFVDWNPKTNAGVYDWYIGVLENSGGDTFPLYRYEHLEATEKANNWLHIRTIWYNENGSKAWEYEYDTPCEPVDMPETPEL